MEAQLSPQDASNMLLEQFSNKDSVINELLDKVLYFLADLDNDSLKVDEKHKLMLQVEYIFTKLRTVVESESIRVKQSLTARVPAAIKALFTQRDSYLTSVSLKLDKIEETISLTYKIHWHYSYNWED